MSTTSEDKLLNQIKETASKNGVSSKLISIWTGVVNTTVSSWNSNTSQPSSENLSDIGRLLEIDSRLLLVPEGRIKTGLGRALENELKKLVKEKNPEYTTEVYNEAGGKKTTIYKPALTKALREFAEKYKSENTARLYPFYFDMAQAEVKEKDIKDTEYFICKADDNNGAFSFLVVSHKNKDKKPVAGFTTLDDAQDYVDYMEGF